MKLFRTILLVVSAAAMLTAQVLGNMSAFTWFDQVERKSTITEQELIELTPLVYQALKANQQLEATLAARRDDHTSRIVFLTIGDDLWPARVYLGSGFSFNDALLNAVNSLREKEAAMKPEIVKQANATIKEAEDKHKLPSQDWLARRDNPGQWNWLKLQVVQAVKPVNNFSFKKSKFAFTDLIGFAFGPSVGFAFTPDQITGRYLLTPAQFVSKQQIGNIIAETLNFPALSTWLQLSSMDVEQRICLFEVDTYFTDGTTTERLFRGHRLPSLPRAAEIRQAAVAGAQALCQRLNPRNGELEPPFPDWIQSQHKSEDLDDMAELAIVLRNLARLPGQEAFHRMADTALLPLRKAILTYGPNKQNAAVTELEKLPDTSPRKPRTLAHLRTNALALVAILEALTEQPETIDEQLKQHRALLTRQAQALAAFVASLEKPDGGFFNAAVMPEATTLSLPRNDWEAIASDNALASLALLRAAQKFDHKDWRMTALSTRRLVVTELAKHSTAELVVEPWIVEALCAEKPATQAHMNLLKSIASAFIQSRTKQVNAPDMAGAPAVWPGYLLAARNAWAMAILARSFQPFSASYEEAVAAELGVTTAFHFQARMDLAAASSLPRPRFYFDFFRSNPDDFEFTLVGQTSQLFALLRTAQLLDDFHHGVFPDEEMTLQQLKSARRFIDIHPGFLKTDIITNSMGTSDDVRSLVGDMTDVKTTQIKDSMENVLNQRQDKVRTRRKR